MIRHDSNPKPQIPNPKSQIVKKSKIKDQRRKIDVISQSPLVTRFAPSPTGYLHLGHVVNAIYVWGMAQALGGSVLVRIEDHDRVRSRSAFDAALMADLEWLGLLDDPATSPGVQRQSARTPVYEDALRRLRASQHVFACDCSRRQIGGERYTGRCRDRGVPETRGTGLRVRVGPGTERFHDLRLGPLEQDPADQCGDLLIRDRDGQWTYQFAVTVDDLLQGVTLVVRGLDLLASTGRQIRLARMLTAAGGLSSQTGPQPAYLHHPLIQGDDGHKLSKATGSTSVRMLRAAGVSSSEVIGRAAAATGLLDVPRPVHPGRLGALLRERAQLETEQWDTVISPEEL